MKTGPAKAGHYDRDPTTVRLTADTTTGHDEGPLEPAARPTLNGDHREFPSVSPTTQE
jgi:hypothetical protein